MPPRSVESYGLDRPRTIAKAGVSTGSPYMQIFSGESDRLYAHICSRNWGKVAANLTILKKYVIILKKDFFWTALANPIERKFNIEKNHFLNGTI